ncbi:MAG: VanZ family protein [Clostridia bacterium]|nr:VanZ family protein [Clostridia bacterium]
MSEWGKRIIYLFLLLVWMSMVFLFSNQNANKSSETSNIIVKKVALMFQVTEPEGVENISFVIRKLAHFSLYTLGGILAFLFFDTFHAGFWKTFVASLGFGILYAMTDEFHQFFIPGRSGELRDVLIDSSRSFDRNNSDKCIIAFLE